MTTATMPLRTTSTSRFRPARTLRYLALYFGLVLVLIPVYVLLVTSFKSGVEATATNAWTLPQNWTLENWAKAWDTLSPSMWRSVQFVIPQAIVAAFLGSLNGFVLSRWRFRGANIVFTLILFGMFIPYQAVIIPLNQLLLGLNVPSGVPSLLLLHIVYGIPICTLIFRNYYESVPNELIEAARVDGAGMFRTYASVVLPISIPSFVVVLIWQFTSAWNDFLFAVFFSTAANGPVTLALNNLANGAQLQDYGASMAGALLASLPTLVVYILLGKYFVGGLMSGSVKG
ncbi:MULTISPECIES: carbohydrate ABC transporter permease [unclassified Pseudactinotalea]|uniref:carbohydrate ABC transporter permease n=1 Tax=unclassified Pseudactinotalea TaxID=2649176 RepID=UPI00128C9EA6|nr:MULTISPECIES: carbohydrate ABC transporter permease [unclassified Pseudactinotalea]MPV49552.1 ABC transporter permease subunit [Pseudactinotalea sp. HY160]QGH69855.1 ABC transporter permease subunit [Pseudactinotalea sp. HY158]